MGELGFLLLSDDAGVDEMGNKVAKAGLRVSDRPAYTSPLFDLVQSEETPVAAKAGSQACISQGTCGCQCE